MSVGVSVLDTETNFVLLSSQNAERIYNSLCEQGVLIRKLSQNMLRITAGSDSEQEVLLSALSNVTI